MPARVDQKGQVHIGLRGQGIVHAHRGNIQWGNIGLREFIPTSVIYEPGHIGRSGLDEWRVLHETCQALLGQDARRLRSLIPPALECEDGSSIVDGIDFALHDLVGRASGLPVWALLGGLQRRSVAACQIIHTDTPEGGLPSEYVPPDDYVRTIAVKNPYAVRDGEFHVPDAPGLGVEPDLDQLDLLTVKKAVIC